MAERPARHRRHQRNSLAGLDHGQHGVELGALNKDFGREAHAVAERDGLPPQAVGIVHQDHGYIPQEAQRELARFAKKMLRRQCQQELVFKEILGLHVVVRNRRTENGQVERTAGDGGKQMHGWLFRHLKSDARIAFLRKTEQARQEVGRDRRDDSDF
jgi:hypothetical protein